MLEAQGGAVERTTVSQSNLLMNFLIGDSGVISQDAYYKWSIRI